MFEIPPRQFLIAGDTWAARGTASFPLDGRHLIVGPDTQVHDIVNATGHCAGYLIGAPIDLSAGSFVEASVAAPVAPDGAGISDSTLTAWMEQFAGPFHAVLRNGAGWIVTSSAGNSCVYDTAEGTVASTTAALMSPDAFEDRFEIGLYESAGVLKGSWLPAGLTCHRDVKRLLPNHTLDLDTLSARRFWHGRSRQEWSAEALANRVGDIATRTIEIAAQRHKLVLALTAGRDSRAILALARPFCDNLETVTISHDNADLDAVVAREMSMRLGLPHIQLSPRFADEPAQHAWLYRNGRAVGGINRELHPTLHHFDQRYAVLAGSFGEVGRGFYWSSSDHSAKQMTAVTLAGRLDLPANRRILSAIGDWHTGLAGMERRHMLDLAYVENRLGCWAAPQYYADPELCFHAGPLENLEIFDCLMSLPEDWREEGKWIDYLICERWPRWLTALQSLSVQRSEPLVDRPQNGRL